MSCTLVAPALPELVYDRVTVSGPAGDAPALLESAFVTPITDEATVVVSVLVIAAPPDVSETDGVIVPVVPVAVAAGTVPATTKRNTAPAARGPVVVIGVADAGVGFQASLAPAHGRRFGDRWGDAAALEAALIQGVSRFRDPGRGQGLKGIRNYVSRWDGKLTIRSGTARIALVPSWDDDVPLDDGLSPFPGAQVLLIVPEQKARHS